MWSEGMEFNRRVCLFDGSLYLLAAGTVSASSSLLYGYKPAPVRFGLVTDLHFADKPPAGTRHYRQTLNKIQEAGTVFEAAKPRFVIQLGDFIDAAETTEQELAYLKRIHKEFSKFPGRQLHVLGNHCVYTLTKTEFLGEVEQERSFFSFDEDDCHFIVLDSCFRSDGTPYGRKNFVWTDPNIPEAELEWLRRDLQNSSKRCVVFAHQRLDVDNHYGVKNAVKVRAILEASDKILAVFQGHSHQNDHKLINGIHYCTMVAMVEGSGDEHNGYSTIEIMDQDTIRVTGHRKQASYEWGASR